VIGLVYRQIISDFIFYDYWLLSRQVELSHNTF
jgi:hypothetical protein